MMAAYLGFHQFPGLHCQEFHGVPRTSWTHFTLPAGLSKGSLRRSSLSMAHSPPFVPSLNGGLLHLSPDLARPPSFAMEFLDAWDDEYNGVIIETNCLPSRPNAFASMLRASMSIWKSKGKRGVWLKILTGQAYLVPIAIQWVDLENMMEQPFYQEDHMSKKMIEICSAAYDDRYDGFVTQNLISKLDGKMTHFYYKR